MTLLKVLGLYVFPIFKYFSKYFAQIYWAQYGAAMLVLTLPPLYLAYSCNPYNFSKSSFLIDCIIYKWVINCVLLLSPKSIKCNCRRLLSAVPRGKTVNQIEPRYIWISKDYNYIIALHIHYHTYIVYFIMQADSGNLYS